MVLWHLQTQGGGVLFGALTNGVEEEKNGPTSNPREVEGQTCDEEEKSNKKTTDRQLTRAQLHNEIGREEKLEKSDSARCLCVAWACFDFGYLLTKSVGTWMRVCEKHHPGKNGGTWDPKTKIPQQWSVFTSQMSHYIKGQEGFPICPTHGQFLKKKILMSTELDQSTPRSGTNRT